MRTKRLGSLAFLLLVLAFAWGVFFGRHHIYDWYRLRNYTPPQRIIELADDTAMNPAMRRIFYVNHPELDDKSTFNTHCRENEQTIVLGCFIENQGIYLLKVDDDRLNGVEEVTAAHEALHAAYARLGKRERTRIDSLVTAAFSQVKTEELTETIELYRKKDPKVVANELHSILGTEVSTLPPELEAHYAKYFTDRQKIVAYAKQYNQVFIDERNQVIEYDAQLTALKAQIEQLESQLSAQADSLEQKRNNLNQLRSQGKTAEYNAAVPAYNAQVNSYNAQADTLRSLIAQYNAIVPKRNAIANEQQELVKAIDSRDVQSAPGQ